MEVFFSAVKRLPLGYEREFLLGNGDFDRNAGTLRLDVECPDVAAMLLHDAIADAKAQARALANALGRKERIKNSLGITEADTIVRDGDADDPVIQPRANGDAFPATPLNGFKGIVQQIHKNLLELRLVEAN